MNRNWNGWTQTAKPYDRDRPMHRINVPASSFLPGATPATGFGFQHGCHVPKDIPFISAIEIGLAILATDPREAVRTVPSWVPVEKPDDLREVEGVLLRSYQTWTDTPLFQWHYWYDWNLFIDPEPWCSYLRGAANKPPKIDLNDDKAKEGFVIPVIRDFDERGGSVTAKTMECEFDCGLFGSRLLEDGKRGTRDDSPGPMFEEDLAWPMAGQMLWASGNWIYDCGHPTEDVKPRFKDDPKQGLTRTELHPLRALATARWEAVKFPENDDLAVPAIQFMFLTTRLGGYTNFSTMTDQDYEFIVDLPKFVPSDQEWDIGHSFKFPRNTGVLRQPRLLFKTDFGAYKRAISKTFRNSFPVKMNPGGLPLKMLEVKPIVELVQPFDPEKPQAKVRVPLAGQDPNAHAYGFILSMGWWDPDRTAARKVKEVTVSNLRITVGADDHEEFSKGTGEWQIRIGVNGRWFHKRQVEIRPGDKIVIGDADPKRLNFFLAEEDFLQVAAHGEETDNVHDVYNARTDEDRHLKFKLIQLPLIPIIFSGIIDGDPIEYKKHVMDPDLRMTREIVLREEQDMAKTLGQQSNPLGRIDPGHNGPNNPLLMKSPPAQLLNSIAAPLTTEVGKSAELAEKAGSVDYVLEYQVDIKDQVIP